MRKREQISILSGSTNKIYIQTDRHRQTGAMLTTQEAKTHCWGTLWLIVMVVLSCVHNNNNYNNSNNKNKLLFNGLKIFLILSGKYNCDLRFLQAKEPTLLLWPMLLVCIFACAHPTASVGRLPFPFSQASPLFSRSLTLYMFVFLLIWSKKFTYTIL